MSNHPKNEMRSMAPYKDERHLEATAQPLPLRRTVGKHESSAYQPLPSTIELLRDVMTWFQTSSVSIDALHEVKLHRSH